MTAYEILKKQKYELVPQEFYEKIAEWLEIYRNEYSRDYNVFNGVNAVGMRYKSLCLPKKIAEEKADLLVNEKLEISVDDEKARGLLDEIFEAENFRQTLNRLVETSSALGSGAIIVGMESGKIRLRTAQAYNIFPLNFDGANACECAFAGEWRGFTYIQKHLYNGKYAVCNEFYTASGDRAGSAGSLGPQAAREIPEIFETNSKIPLFVIVTPNSYNNVCSREIPLGMSIFENSRDLIKSIDVAFDSFSNEFILGKKRLFIKDELLKSKARNGVPLFDTRDVLFYGLDLDGENGITESNMTLRIDEHTRGIQAMLDLLGDAVGLGTGYLKYSNETNSVKTATEVVSQNSKLYRRLKKDEITMRNAVICVCRAVLSLSGFSDEQIGGMSFSVGFDDSIIEDTAVVANRALVEFNAGIIDRVEYFRITRGLSEENAIILAKSIEERVAGNDDF